MAENEYIEREAAKKVLAYDYAYNAAKLLDEVPKADVQKVRHGKWVCLEHEIGLYSCSCCSHNILRAKCNFCPHCGAKMDKE